MAVAPRVIGDKPDADNLLLDAATFGDFWGTTAILFDEPGESGVFLPGRKIFSDFVSVAMG